MTGIAKPIVVKELLNGCWVCISLKGKRGAKPTHQYPTIRHRGKYVQLSRYMYEEFVSPIPKKLVAMHTCDNTLCVNPSHIVIGTQQQNIDDSIVKNRTQLFRSKKLTKKQITEIFNNRTGSCTELGKKYDVSRSTISLIRRGEVCAWHTLGERNRPRHKER